MTRPAPLWGGVPSRWTARGPLESRYTSRRGVSIDSRHSWVERCHRSARVGSGRCYRAAGFPVRELRFTKVGPMTGRLPHAGVREPSLVVRGHRETVSSRSVFQRGVITFIVHRRDAVQRLRVRQGRDDVALRGGRDARSGGERTPRPPVPPSPRSAGEALIFFTTLAIFDSPFPPRTRPGPRAGAGAGAGAGARGCRRNQGKSERDPRLETPPVTASQGTGPLVRSRGGPQMTSHRAGIPKSAEPRA